ncbi:leishmanolysin-related zinc metalloendopeptidase [Cognatiyoonia sp. IB215182]|uniref:leishmanolysin-related zinc metalloendopeptidase n=1 Tax=Cognatiyoonia sp. IB215182 TaxID=3097353 RepID=UPI002A0DCC3C|nr:leishmanolysin-related zinc metalloendopeptidase [Cognatiyoonia sp. IB215182]MDX8350944.1 leishmanolysin-related zinc metalloendopeptidase [Cognatiyoonia sp. IB215182]
MITLNFAEGMSAARRGVFDRAARRWDTVIDTSFAPTEVDGDVLTGVRIDATIEDIDGESGILGQAGPTALRGDTGLPVTGVMQFDSADVAKLESEGRFEDVILHEMAHVLGFGTLWARKRLIRGRGSMDPRFTGPASIREYAALDPEGGDAVPLSNTGGEGTREGHWRELIFGDELLTGFLSGTERPLSRLSVAAFEDIGYTVDYSRADSYVLPSFRELVLMGVTEAVRICDLCRVGRPEPIVLEDA